MSRVKLTGVPAQHDSLQALAQRVAEATDGTPEREELLRRLTEQVRTGEYRVDAEALADILLKQMPVDYERDDGDPPSQK